MAIKMGLRASMLILLFGIFFGTAVEPADGLDVGMGECMFSKRDWIDKGLDFVHGKDNTKMGPFRFVECYSEQEKIGFVVAVVVLVLIVLCVLHGVFRLGSRFVVVVRRDGWTTNFFV